MRDGLVRVAGLFAGDQAGADMDAHGARRGSAGHRDGHGDPGGGQRHPHRLLVAVADVRPAVRPGREHLRAAHEHRRQVRRRSAQGADLANQFGHGGVGELPGHGRARARLGQDDVCESGHGRGAIE